MKVSMIETPIIEEIDMLKEKTIQGLYPVKGAHESFWNLLSKVELSIFREHKERGEKP